MIRSAPVTPPIVDAVRAFVADDVEPVAAALEHTDAYPRELVERMKALGLFGTLVPSEYGGLGLDVQTYARVIEEICRSFMSLAGVLNSHTMAALIVLNNGTPEQRARLLPRFASGQARGGLCLTEPHAGSDVQAIRTVARRDGDRYLISGSKMFVTNGREGNTFALLALTDPSASPRHRGMSCFIVEKGAPGLSVVKSIAKLGYKGVDTAELVFDGFPCPAANLVGGVEGRGFKHVMSGLETGRINIAARASGVARRALEEAVKAADPAVPAPALADILVQAESARLVTGWAAAMKDRGERCDLEAGIAKLHASEAAHLAASLAMAVVGRSSQLSALAVERLHRDTPLMIIGEGTNEIQRLVIARSVLERQGERGAALPAAGLADERRQLVLTVRQVVDKEVAPVAGLLESRAEYPSAIMERLGSLGLWAALVPVESGGLGLDAVAHAMLAEELSRGWAVVATLASAQAIAAGLLARFADARGRERLVSDVTTGARPIALVVGPGITARPSGDGWALSGRATLVDNAARAASFVVAADVPDGAPASALFLVDRDAHRVAVGAPEDTLGGRGREAGDVVLDGVHVGATARLGDGAAAALAALARVSDAAIAIGLAQAALEAAVRYSRERTAFGQPICQHQAIQLKLADMAARVTVARRLTQSAAEAIDAGLDADVPARAAWIDASQTASAVTLESMRIHGGYGYTREFAVERLYRDAAWLAASGAPLDAERIAIARRLVSGDVPLG